MLLILITALIPAVILGWWIYKKDSAQPEPPQMLAKAFLYGVGSTFVTLVITSFMSMMGVMVYELGSFAGAVSTALFAAALPEEIAKLLMLWLFLRKNPFYDEYFDGIVYAACVGLGFAGTENVLYLLQSEDWLGTGIVRGITAVPAHFAIACAMGYFYSKRHFGDRSRFTACCVLAVPVLIHWVYDALAFSEGIFPALSVVINVLFVVLIWIVYKRTMGRIDDLQRMDNARRTPPPLPGSGPTLPPPPPPFQQ
jgi:RsiW-degrading membrane proteinase PrsW (M82 family)